MEIEVRISSLDTSDVTLAQEVLISSELTVELWPLARTIDPETVLVVTGTTVNLINGLLVLRDRWKARKSAPPVVVRGPDSREADLLKVERNDLTSLIGPDESL